MPNYLSGASSAFNAHELRPRVDVYRELTDLVLDTIRPEYEKAGLPCTDVSVAIIVATLFAGRQQSQHSQQSQEALRERTRFTERAGADPSDRRAEGA